MSLTIILYTVLAAAIAAGAGFLASGLLQGVLDLKYRPYWLVALVAGAAGTATFAIMWSTEESVGRLRLAGHEGEQLTFDVPAATHTAPGQGDPFAYIDGLKTENPLLYNQVKAAVEADLKAGDSQTLALARARDKLNDYIAKKSPYLPDEVIVERFTLLRDVLSYLSARGENDICADMALGMNRSGVRHYLSDELVGRDTANVAHIIAAVRDEAAPKLPPEEFKNLTNAAFVRAAESSSIELEEVETLLTGTGDPKKACALMTGFFDALVSLPQAQSGAALRTMSAGEQASSAPPPPPQPVATP